MEQVNKLTEAVTQLTSPHNGDKLDARSTADPENSDNSYSWEGDEKTAGLILEIEGMRAVGKKGTCRTNKMKKRSS